MHSPGVKKTENVTVKVTNSVGRTEPARIGEAGDPRESHARGANVCDLALEKRRESKLRTSCGYDVGNKGEKKDL